VKVLEIIGFGIGDAIEVLLVAYILYQLYLLMRGTIAVQIALGLGALFLIQFVVQLADMTVLTTVFSYFNQVFVLAVIIIFQPEIRRLLLLLGKNPIVRRFVATTDQSEMIDETVGAVEAMSEQQIGALIAFQRSTGLRGNRKGFGGRRVAGPANDDFLRAESPPRWGRHHQQRPHRGRPVHPPGLHEHEAEPAAGPPPPRRCRSH
jgi:hypothetical protein